MKNWILGILIPVVGSLALNSCSKETMQDEFSSITEDLLLQKVEERINKETDAVSIKCLDCGVDELAAALAGCVKVKDSGEGSYPRTIIIDYGNGCTLEGELEKRGKMIIKISDDLANPGAERRVSFEDFYIDNRAVMGTQLLVNITEEDLGSPLFAYEHDIKIQEQIGLYHKISEGTRQWIRGFETADTNEDDVFD